MIDNKLESTLNFMFALKDNLKAYDDDLSATFQEVISKWNTLKETIEPWIKEERNTECIICNKKVGKKFYVDNDFWKVCSKKCLKKSNGDGEVTHD